MFASMSSSPFLTGQLLLAMPGIGDPRFERSVIAMCSHDEEGALGIGIGTVIDSISFHDVLKQLDIEPGEAPDVPVHLGGPVEPRRGFVLHSRDWSGADTIDVAGRWSLSGTVDVLPAGAGIRRVERRAARCRVDPARLVQRGRRRADPVRDTGGAALGGRLRSCRDRPAAAVGDGRHRLNVPVVRRVGEHI
jgi:hypothetical protein